MFLLSNTRLVVTLSNLYLFPFCKFSIFGLVAVPTMFILQGAIQSQLFVTGIAPTNQLKGVGSVVGNVTHPLNAFPHDTICCSQ